MTVGLSPKSSLEVNSFVGGLMLQFQQNRDACHQQHDWLAATDLKVDPYNFSPDDETLIKTAVNELDTALQSVDMTFISRLIGMPLS